MSEYEIVEVMDTVKKQSDQIVGFMLGARQQGRMLSITEAKRMDTLSLELLQGIRILSQNPCSEFKSQTLRLRAGEVLELAKQTLEQAIQPELRKAQAPRAASSRMDAYCAC